MGEFMKSRLLVASLIIVFLSITFLTARSFRVGQIPNGSEFSCENCHFNPGGGGARNAFGEEISGGFLSNGNVVWGAELASLDSDGDGFTNGEELQDPDGAWIQGSAAPGDPSLVTNPGDPSSTPDPVSVAEYNGIPTRFALLNNYPNPFNPSTNIEFITPRESHVKIEIFNSNGQLIKTLTNQNYSSGRHHLTWDAKDNNGSRVTSGIYFYRLSTDNFVQTNRMVLLK